MWLVIVLLTTDVMVAGTIYFGAMWASCVNENRLPGNQTPEYDESTKEQNFAKMFTVL